MMALDCWFTACRNVRKQRPLRRAIRFTPRACVPIRLSPGKLTKAASMSACCFQSGGSSYHSRRARRRHNNQSVNFRFLRRVYLLVEEGHRRKHAVGDPDDRVAIGRCPYGTLSPKYPSRAGHVLDHGHLSSSLLDLLCSFTPLRMQLLLPQSHAKVRSESEPCNADRASNEWDRRMDTGIWATWYRSEEHT